MSQTVTCNHFPECSGCSLIGVSYAEQLDRKLCDMRSLVAQSKLRHFDADSIESIAASDRISSYRNRAKLVPATGVDAARSGTVRLGLFKAGTHDVVDIPGCAVQTDEINRTVELIRAGIARCGVSLYDEVTHTGDLRFVTVRHGVGTGQILVGFVTRADSFTGGESLARYLMDSDPSLVGVVQNVNPDPGNVIFGQTTRVLAGRDYLEESVSGVRVRLGVTSFFQVNTGVAELAYGAIVDGITQARAASAHRDADDKRERGGNPEAADDKSGGISTLLDLYSGVGTIGLVAARRVGRVMGIEELGESIELARASALDNGIDNITFEQARVEDRLPSLAAELRSSGREADGVGVAADEVGVVVNPPRKGLFGGVADQLIDLGAARIAYLSCAPQSLVRDLARLEGGGYRVQSIELFDMFPQTTQVETLAMLSRW